MKRRPMHPCNLTPIELIGPDDYEFLKQHFIASQKITDPDKYDERISKKFTDEERAVIVELYTKLRSFGVYPSRIGSDGQIEWKVMIRSEIQDYVEQRYPQKCDDCACPEGECNGYSKEDIEKMKVWARSKSIGYEIDAEGGVI